jgi:hypothetical protein
VVKTGPLAVSLIVGQASLPVLHSTSGPPVVDAQVPDTVRSPVLKKAGPSARRGSAVGLFHNPVGDPYTKTLRRATASRDQAQRGCRGESLVGTLMDARRTTASGDGVHERSRPARLR